MEGSLVVLDSAVAAVGLCAKTAAGRRHRAAGRSGGASIVLSCTYSSRDHDEPATRARASSSSSFGRMRMRRAVNSVAPVNGGGWTPPSLQEESSVLEAREDEYGGVVVDADRLPHDVAAFARSLPVSLSCWKSLGKKGVWLKLPLDRSEYIPLAVKEGFRYHHAEDSYLMLTYWIPDDEPCKLPANASHQVGVGGVVINDRMEVLVVQEKYSRLRGAWKLPTGLIHASEEIFTGAVREVKEETGVDTEFVELIVFRHAHNVAFQKSDLFFVCVLRPLSNDIKIDETEIQAAKWMPLRDWMERPFIQDDHMFRMISDVCMQRLRHRRHYYCGLTAHHVVSKFDGRASTLYYNVAAVVQPDGRGGDLDCDDARSRGPGERVSEYDDDGINMELP